MATQSPFNLSFKQALQEASAKNARRFEILVTLEPETEQPIHIALRKPNTPTKQTFGFTSMPEAEDFLKQLADMADAR